MDEQENNNENKEMNENQEQNLQKESHTMKECFERKCWKKCLAMTLAAFLGGFLAVYFVTDQVYKHKMEHFKRPMAFHKFHHSDWDNPFGTEEDISKEIMRMKRHHDRMMHDLERSPWDIEPFFANPVKIKTDLKDDKFVVKINLKDFNNDESKIQYKLDGRKLTISGENNVKDEDYENDISFSQDLILPAKTKLDEVKTSKEGNNWVLSVPVEK